MELGQAFMIALFTLLALNATIMYFFFYKDAPSTPPQQPQQTQQSLPPPTEILSLRIYPIKSCRGFSVPSARLLKTGLDLDRNWMFIDASKRKFLTIRQLSKMTLIDTALSPDDELIVSIRTEPKARISIPAHPSRDWLEANTTLRSADIWGTETDAWEYAPSLTAPFSEFFHKDVRLVYKGPTPRVLKGNGAPEHLGRTEATKFADLAPVQVSSMASMEELNGRLKAAGEDEISIERFRPNIVVRGSVPWAEDSWKTLRIGSGDSGPEAEKPGKEGGLVLDVAARCARCQVPNVDPDTAVKHKRQPWDMLMKYRVVDEGITYKPCFGMLCVPREEGTIEVGMSLEVTELTEDHKYIKGM
ncbi:hypothetical protein W97_06939 [Coniosporium apollinis CBS 100218]|uniref:MOSC domain-containing protein n=1 Tax=Coniosporium apollinis (strain CBS 100218) TaxID=1168221 RepID=R7Z0Y6_CONA1|nr:uncharacterized protein W97_06939 [Coniosporium apollinis CBS 100218]EON67571.1 hypothetical protein W97_06939 [Coniosporium apollinis CBS 100218]